MAPVGMKRTVVCVCTHVFSKYRHIGKLVSDTSLLWVRGDLDGGHLLCDQQYRYILCMAIHGVLELTVNSGVLLLEYFSYHGR